MPSVNKVIVLGNLGRDPEVRFTPNGSAVCNISIATTRSWKNKESGDKVEETEWHRVVLYDRLAEIAGEFLRKGRPVYIEGRLKTRKWTSEKDNIERYSTEIVAESMQLLGGAENAAGGASGAASGGASAPAPAPRAPAPAPTPTSGVVRTPPKQSQQAHSHDNFSEDIPF